MENTPGDNSAAKAADLEVRGFEKPAVASEGGDHYTSSAHDGSECPSLDASDWQSERA